MNEKEYKNLMEVWEFIIRMDSFAKNNPDVNIGYDKEVMKYYANSVKEIAYKYLNSDK